MAAKMACFGYHSDDGNVYLLRRSQHHLEAVGIRSCGHAEYRYPPGDMRPRYVVARHPHGKTTPSTARR